MSDAYTQGRKMDLEIEREERESKPPRQSYRASTSFTDPEVDCLAQLFETLRCGGDVSGLVRHDVFRGIARKVANMKAKIEREKRRDVLSGRPEA